MVDSAATVLNLRYFQALDRADPLAPFRTEFSLPEDTIYLNGNSLGVLPHKALQIADRTLRREWGGDLVKSWNTADWFHLPQRLGNKLAPLIGAAEDEVVVTDATGINLFKTMSAALGLRPERSVIVMDGSDFPTNNYAVQGLVKLLGNRHTIRFAEREQIANAIDANVAVLCLNHVHYKSGHVLDMHSITRNAQSCGVLTVWDLCHSAGVLPVDLNTCQVDFAVGCTYKYLNGGPGSPAFVFMAKRHHRHALQALTGWWGHAEPFAFERDYEPAPGITQMLSGTQPIVSLALVEAGLDIALLAPIDAVRAKSKKITDLFVRLVETSCAGYGFSLASPRDAEARGSQVALQHEHGFAIVQALLEAKIIGDFRAPDILRFGFAPLYVRYVDVWHAVQGLCGIMQSESWRAEKYTASRTVT